MDTRKDDRILAAVPLFPLPNVVLFPRAILPLHIFEQRYREMTADAIERDRRIAMALLNPGWEKSYYSRPSIQPVVCVGEILTWEKLPDGKYNLLLQGKLRARVVREQEGRAYRTADLEPLDESPTLDIDLELERRSLGELFDQGKLSRIPVARQFRHLLSSPLPIADVADLIAFNLIEDVNLKQDLLGDTDVRRRVQRVVKAITTWSAHVNPALNGLPADPSVN